MGGTLLKVSGPEGFFFLAFLVIFYSMKHFEWYLPPQKSHLNKLLIWSMLHLSHDILSVYIFSTIDHKGVAHESYFFVSKSQK